MVYGKHRSNRYYRRIEVYMKKTLFISLIIIIAFIFAGCQRQGGLFCPDECKAADIYEEWVPVWCDEFLGDTLDFDKWNVLDTAWGGGNNEAQYYHPDNVTVAAGRLIITARHESHGGKEYTS